MPNKTYTACKSLMLVLFCAAGLIVNAQEPVEAGISTFDYQGCVPVKVQFADSSSGGPTEWFWDFGNGQTSTKSNPAITYTVPGIYTVKLIVKNSVSIDSTTKEVNISGARAEFNYSYTNICTTPATINFSVTNSQKTILYRWDFGDENKDIVPVTSNTFTAPGKYDVHLTTISPEGCEDSIVKTIQIGSGTANFTAPSTACVNEPVVFNDTSSPHSLSAVWKINNAVVQQTTGDLTYQFTRPGTYTVQLEENFGSCVDVATKRIQVLNKPSAAFSLSGLIKSCTYPDTIKFVNTSVNANAYLWLFGDGDSSREVNPIHVYQAGRFSPTLIAYNANGCTDTLIKPDEVFLGGAIINDINLPDSGCAPHPVTFVADIATPEAITNYLWDFGDGGTDVIAQPTHTYSTSGKYNVSLTVTTVSGCTTTQLFSKGVSVGTRSVPDFTIDKTTACGSEPIFLNGTASGPVSMWTWKAGYRSFAFTQNARYSAIDTGSTTIKLIVNNEGCVDSVVKKDFVQINGPVSAFKATIDCDNRANVRLEDRSIAPESWEWNYGDGTISKEQIPPVHTYSEPGPYPITLITRNGACSDTATITAYISTKKPVFSFNPPNGQICRNADLELGVDNPSYIIDYLWSMDDGRTLFSDTSIHYSYTKAGTYYPSLIARYTNGCQDTIVSPDPIKVNGPTASFATALPANCLNDTTYFTDSSITDGEHDIIDHIWTYGDNSSAESDNDSTVSHLYTNSGTYNASLVVADNNNCFDTAYYNVVVNALPVVSAGLDTFVCEGSGVQLQPSGADSYIWNRSPDLSCFRCDSPIASPLQAATYVVTGTDANSCRASDSVQVEVVYPQTLTLDNTPQEICATKSVQLSASGVDLYTWSPGDGLSNTSVGTPIASPPVTTTYYVTGTDSRKCFSQTDSVIVTVYPNPDVTITNNDLTVEKGSNNLITTAGSDNIVKWYWYPSLGLSCTDCPQPTVIAEKTLTYSAVVYTDFGCTDTAQVNVHVLCNQSQIYIPSAFTPNGDGKNERFYVLSSVDNPVQNFLVYSRAGELIFNKRAHASNSSADGWDGTYKGKPAPAGTYIYRIEVMCNSTVVPFTGTVTLIR